MFFIINIFKFFIINIFTLHKISTVFTILTLEDFQDKSKITIVRIYLFQSMKEQNERTTATPAEIGYLMFMCEQLNDDGIFMVRKISNRDFSILIVPLSAVIDAACQADGSVGIFYKFNQCQMRRPVRFKFLKPDFTVPISGTDMNVVAETKWILVLRLTPID